MKHDDGYSALLTYDGIYIANSLNKSKNGTPFVDDDLTLPQLTVGSSAFLYDDDGSLHVFQSLDIAGVDENWTFLSVVPRDSIFEDLSNTMRAVFLVSILIFCFYSTQHDHTGTPLVKAFKKND